MALVAAVAWVQSLAREVLHATGIAPPPKKKNLFLYPRVNSVIQNLINYLHHQNLCLSFIVSLSAFSLFTESQWPLQSLYNRKLSRLKA